MAATGATQENRFRRRMNFESASDIMGAFFHGFPGGSILFYSDGRAIACFISLKKSKKRPS
jgi:hypothetical protein